MSGHSFPFAVIPGSPPELLVYDRLHDCPYLPGRVSRMPLRLPTRRLRRREADGRWAVGDRRQGHVLYRVACPECHACEPIRIDVNRYQLSRSERRTLRCGDRLLRATWAAPLADARRVELYNLHKQLRGLGDGSPPLQIEGYRDFLVNSCCESRELRLHLGRELVGVAVADRGLRSLSAVYCAYDPRVEGVSPGTYAILKQLIWCREHGLRHLYLGLYIADCAAMRYKARFLPHERLIDGRWRAFRPAR